jgi:hypothetical protein
MPTARASVALVAATLAACTYSPKIPGGAISCSPDGGRCPAGFSCTPFSASASFCAPVDKPISGDGGPTVEAAVLVEGGAEAEPPPADAAPVDAPTADRPADDAAVPDARLPLPDTRPSEPLPLNASVPAGGCLSSGRGPELIRAEGFCIDATEVTNRQYQAFLEESDLSKQPPGCIDENFSFVPGSIYALWPPPAGREDHPVVNIDWCDAASFCSWAGKRLCGPIKAGAIEPKQATMPSLSRWASACTRAGTWKLPYGPDVKTGLCNVAQANLPVRTVPVGSLPGCQGGYDKLYDMVGNVEEWVDACRTDPATGVMCAVIGGNYFDGESAADCARFSEDRRKIAVYFRGFRCCWP